MKFGGAVRAIAARLRGTSTASEALEGLLRVVRGERGRWEEALARSRGGPRVLLATSLGGHPPAVLTEATLAAALVLRGASPTMLLCDGVLPACQMCEHGKIPDASVLAGRGPQASLCRWCSGPALRVLKRIGIPVLRYGELLRPGEVAAARARAAALGSEEILAHAPDGLALGEHARAGALRYFARGTIPEGPDALGVLRRYLAAAEISRLVAERCVDRLGPASACLHHGIYVPQGILAEVFRARALPFSTWNVAYRKRCFIFSHGETYHHALLAESVGAWKDLPWSPALEARIMTYLKSRWVGSEDWIWFHEKPVVADDRVLASLGIDRSIPLVGMLTNVFWDAQLHYRANAFRDMLDWAVKTVRYFAGRPDLRLVIRIHPAEIRGTVPSRQPLAAELAKAFPRLPPNVIVVPPESDLSTYALMGLCDAAIIYGTKTGVELTAVGIPVVVAGEAWIRGKGLTLDASSEEEYFRILDRLPLRERLGEEQVREARKYAFHFFFRRMIPLRCMVPSRAVWPFALGIAGLDGLRPGADPGLDVVCAGILAGEPFVYPAEREAPGPGGAGTHA